jgi:hypothetical protein
MQGNIWQALQVLLDSRAISQLEALFYAADHTLRHKVLKIYESIMRPLSRLRPNLIVLEPFKSIGFTLSSFGWVQGLITLVRGSKSQADTDDQSVAASCLGFLACQPSWMRAWVSCDVMTALSSAAEQSSNDKAQKAAKVSIVAAAAQSPELIDAMLDLNMPVNSTLNATRNISSAALVEEANDLMFGSTLHEQSTFTDKLCSYSRLICSGGDTPLGDIHCLERVTLLMGKWIPKMAASLEVLSDKSKVDLCGSVILRQLDFLEEFIMYALRRHSSDAVKTLATCLLSSESTADEPLGLLLCFDRLVAMKSYINSDICVKIQLKIIDFLSVLIIEKRGDLIDVLHSTGAFRSCIGFIDANIESVRQLSKSKGQVMRDIDILSFYSIRLWGDMLASGSTKVQQSIINTDIISRICQDWASDCSSFGSVVGGKQFTYFIRKEAFQLLYTLVSKKDNVALLIRELESIFNSLFIVKSINESEYMHGRRPSLNTTNNSFSADILTSLCSMDSRAIDTCLMREGVSIDLIDAIRYRDLHPLTHNMWGQYFFVNNTPTEHYSLQGAALEPASVSAVVEPNWKNDRLKNIYLRSSKGRLVDLTKLLSVYVHLIISYRRSSS